MTGNVSTATERVIGTGTGSTGIGNENRMGTEIGRGSGTAAIEIASGTRHDETIGAETTVAVAVVLVRALRGSTRNPGGRTIDAASSGAMMIIVVTVEGAKRARLLAGAVVVAAAVEHGKTLAALRQRGGRRPPKGLSRCRSADARPLDGTSMHQGMSSIPPCKRSKLVGGSLHV